MSDDRHRFLALMGQLPARLTVEQSGWVLNCQPHDVPILVMAKLLKLLGTPAPNGKKYFATVEVLELARDRTWLGKVTNAVGRYWQAKNNKRNSLEPICQ